MTISTPAAVGPSYQWNTICYSHDGGIWVWVDFHGHWPDFDLDVKIPL